MTTILYNLKIFLKLWAFLLKIILKFSEIFLKNSQELAFKTQL